MTARVKGPREDGGRVEVGAVYRKIHKGNIVETARVLNVSPDAQGVAHVRYHLSIERSHQECIDDRRILCLDSFTQQFPGNLRV